MSLFEIVQAVFGLLFLFVVGTLFLGIFLIGLGMALGFWKACIEAYIIDPIVDWKRKRESK